MRHAPQRTIGAFFFMQGLCAATFVSRIPELKMRLHLNDTRLGFALGLMACGGLLALPVAGLAVARFGSRRILVAAAGTHGVTLAAVACVHAWVPLLTVLLIFGMANTVVQISVNAQAVLAERALQRSILAGLHGLWSIAGLCGALLGMAAQTCACGRGAHFGGVSMAMLLGIVCCAPHLPDFNDITASSTSDQARCLRRHLCWRERYLWGLAWLTFAAMFCESAMFDWSGIFYSQWIETTPLWVGLSYSVFMAAMAGGRFVADRCVSRLGVTRVLTLSGFLQATGYLICAALPYRACVFFGFAAVGVGVCAMVPLIVAQTGNAQATPLGVALAFVSTVGLAGAFFGPLFVGFVADHTNLRVSFAGVGLVGLTVAARAHHVLQPAQTSPVACLPPASL